MSVISPTKTVVIVGLDNAGKTTLVKLLQEGKFIQQHEPTTVVNTVNVDAVQVPFKAVVHDMGGHQSKRKDWEEYYAHARAIIFVVDAADEKRIIEARKELQELLGSDWLRILQLPVLVLGNKTDLPSAYSKVQLRAALGIDYEVEDEEQKRQKQTGTEVHGAPGDDSAESSTRSVQLFMCSLKANKGYQDALLLADLNTETTAVTDAFPNMIRILRRRKDRPREKKNG